MPCPLFAMVLRLWLVLTGGANCLFASCFKHRALAGLFCARIILIACFDTDLILAIMLFVGLFDDIHELGFLQLVDGPG